MAAPPSPPGCRSLPVPWACTWSRGARGGTFLRSLPLREGHVVRKAARAGAPPLGFRWRSEIFPVISSECLTSSCLLLVSWLLKYMNYVRSCNCQESTRCCCFSHKRLQCLRFLYRQGREHATAAPPGLRLTQEAQGALLVS